MFESTYARAHKTNIIGVYYTFGSNAGTNKLTFFVGMRYVQLYGNSISFSLCVLLQIVLFCAAAGYLMPLNTIEDSTVQTSLYSCQH